MCAVNWGGKTSFLLLITFGFREVSNEVRNLDGACKAESLNPCYTFFLQEKKPKAQLNFHFSYINYERSETIIKELGALFFLKYRHKNQY